MDPIWRYQIRNISKHISHSNSKLGFGGVTAELHNAFEHNLSKCKNCFPLPWVLNLWQMRMLELLELTGKELDSGQVTNLDNTEFCRVDPALCFLFKKLLKKKMITQWNDKINSEFFSFRMNKSYWWAESTPNKVEGPFQLLSKGFYHYLKYFFSIKNAFFSQKILKYCNLLISWWILLRPKYVAQICSHFTFLSKFSHEREFVCAPSSAARKPFLAKLANFRQKFRQFWKQTN